MKKDKKSLAAAVGASIVTSLSIGTVSAEENPFALKELAQGYTQVAEAGNETTKPDSELKCGAEVMKKNPKMACGASMMKMDTPAVDKKAVETKCAGMKMNKPASAEQSPATPPPAAPK